jgi:putative flippase GtrA
MSSVGASGMNRLWTFWDRNRRVLGYWLTFAALLAAFQVSLTVGEGFWAVLDTATKRGPTAAP